MSRQRCQATVSVAPVSSLASFNGKKKNVSSFQKSKGPKSLQGNDQKTQGLQRPQRAKVMTGRLKRTHCRPSASRRLLTYQSQLQRVIGIDRKAKKFGCVCMLRIPSLKQVKRSKTLKHFEAFESDAPPLEDTQRAHLLRSQRPQSHFAGHKRSVLRTAPPEKKWRQQARYETSLVMEQEVTPNCPT